MLDLLHHRCSSLLRLHVCVKALDLPSGYADEGINGYGVIPCSEGEQGMTPRHQAAATARMGSAGRPTQAKGTGRQGCPAMQCKPTAREQTPGRMLPAKTPRIRARWTPIRRGFARTRPH